MKTKFLKENIAKPLYKQIADWMREKIHDGEWKRDEKLPAEDGLSAELQVSRGTLKKAISLLIEENLLVQIQGKGTFVSEQKISYPFAQELISFAESMEEKGYRFTTTVLKHKVIQPSTIAQKKLGIEQSDPVLYLKRVRYIEGEPVILLENWVDIKKCSGIENDDFEETTLFQAMEKHSEKKIKFGIRNFEARSVNENQAKILHLEKTTPVLFIEQLTFDQDTTPIEFSHIWLRSDKYGITSVLLR